MEIKVTYYVNNVKEGVDTLEFDDETLEYEIEDTCYEALGELIEYILHSDNKRLYIDGDINDMTEEEIEDILYNTSYYEWEEI